MASEGTVNVPVVGPEKKSTVMVFGGLAVLVVVYALYQKKKQAAAAAAAATASTGAATFTDPAGSVCAAPNPATGYCPGTPADTAAQQQLFAGSAAYGTTNGSFMGSLGGGSLSNASNTVPVFTNNGSWATYVEQMLGSNGSDAIAAAIAKYLAGTSLTTDQVTVAEEAVAIANYPPVSGPGGFPPSINKAVASQTTPGTCPSGYSWTSGNDGTSGIIAATAGAGWCVPQTQAAPAASPITGQVANGYGGWMTVSFPSSAAEAKFYSSLGATSNNDIPNGLTPGQLDNAVNAAGGSIVSGSTTAGPTGSVYGEPNQNFPNPVPQQATTGSYTVRHGDTMSSIASMHGVTLAALEAANRSVSNPNLIYPGQVLTIP